MVTRVGKLVMHFSFSKSEVDSKGIGVPVSMHVSIRKDDPMSNDSKANLSREGVKVKR